MTELLRAGDDALITAARTAGTGTVEAGPLRIGLVCPYSLSVPGGVQNHVLGLAGYLTAIGDRVRILAPGELTPQRAAQHGLKPEQFTSVGPAVPVPYNGSVARITFGPRVAGRVRSWLADHRLDLVHIHEPLAPSISLLSLLASAVPVVGTFHTATPRSRLLRAAGVALQPVIDKIDTGIAVSEPARRVVVDHLRRHPRVIPNGIRAREFATGDHAAVLDDHRRPGVAGNDRRTGVTGDDRRPGVAGDHRRGRRPRMVFLGRLDEPRKGLAVLLEALPMIMESHPELEVIIAGQGNLARVTRRLPAGCRALGEVDDATRAELLRTADLFVAPHIARESFGIVLIEAITAGATVIASDLPAFTDLLTDGDGPFGYLFRAGDPAALARTVDRALSEDRRLLDARARAAVARYDWSRVGPSIRAVYAEVVGR